MQNLSASLSVFILKVRRGILIKPYKTIAVEASAEFVEKKSRFIGHIAPVKTEEEAQAFISQISKKHRDASHNVFAYVLKKSGISRCSDNGEPQGTAGVPDLRCAREGGSHRRLCSDDPLFWRNAPRHQAVWCGHIRMRQRLP